jgi:hypothetical protein
MSFSEALIVLLEEPEECCALMEYLCDYHVELFKKQIRYLKPDILALSDDISSDRSPFISLDIYRRIIKPHHKRLADIALDNNMCVMMHCCGNAEPFLDDFVDIGVSGWEPAQAGNDFPTIKKKFGRKLAIMGGWDNTGRFARPSSNTWTPSPPAADLPTWAEWQGASMRRITSERAPSARKCTRPTPATGTRHTAEAYSAIKEAA